MDHSSSKIRRRNDCRLCGGTALELVLPLTPTPLGDSYFTKEHLDKTKETFPIDLYLCRDCGYAHLRDVVDPDEIYPDYIYVSESSLGLRTHFERSADDTIATTGTAADSLVVDIGSNDGTLLRAFKDRGLRVVGVDPAKDIAEKATVEGLPTVGDYFSKEVMEKIRADHGPASLVTANNVFANIDDLETMTTLIRELLADDGVFVVEFAYVGDLIENKVFDYIYHEHLSYFAVTPLKTFFERLGLEPFALQRVPTKGGSIRLYSQKSGSGRPAQESIAAVLREEAENGCTSVERFHLFRQEIDRLKEENRAALRELAGAGLKIAGYGASVTSTTLIYHFGLGEFLEFLVDENEAKQGTFSPGLHIPVHAPDALANPEIDCVLILAWRFADPILKKIPQFRTADCRILIPLPKVNLFESLVSYAAAKK